MNFLNDKVKSICGNFLHLLMWHILSELQYQAGWIWGNTLSQEDTPPLHNWGWKTKPFGSGILPEMMTHASVELILGRDVIHDHVQG